MKKLLLPIIAILLTVTACIRPGGETCVTPNADGSNLSTPQVCITPDTV